MRRPGSWRAPRGRGGGGIQGGSNGSEGGIGRGIDAAYASPQGLIARVRINSESLPNRRTWIINSGASHHLCKERKDFIFFKRLYRFIPVQVGDGASVPAVGIGLIRFHLPNGLRFEVEALYVPKLRYSLLSMSKLTDQYSITFQNSECLISRTSLAVGTESPQSVLGRLTNGTYNLFAQPHHPTQV